MSIGWIIFLLVCVALAAGASGLWRLFLEYLATKSGDDDDPELFV